MNLAPTPTAALLAALLAVTSAFATPASPLRPPDHADVVFARTPQRDLALDIYLPDNIPNPPLLVYVHGGGWRQGNAKDVPFLFLLREGYAIASIRYRFSHEAPFPAQLEDTQAAIAWLRGHGRAHGYNGGRIALIGGSAGAQLAMLAGCTADDRTGPILAVVSFFGPSDFLLRSRTQPDSNNPGSTTHGLLGGPPAAKEDLARAASPAFHVTAHAPPLLIFHGEADKVVLPDQSERMAEAYRAAGRPVTTHYKAGAGHTTGDFEDDTSRKLLLEFLGTQLKTRR